MIDSELKRRRKRGAHGNGENMNHIPSSFSAFSAFSAVRFPSELTEEKNNQQLKARNTRNRGKLSGSFLCCPCVPWFVSLCTQQADRARKWTTTDHTEYTESGEIDRFLSVQSVCSVVRFCAILIYIEKLVCYNQPGHRY